MMRVLHISASDGSGGAGRVASSLVTAQRALGIDAVLAVADKRRDDAHVVSIDDPRRAGWHRWWRHARERVPERLKRVRRVFGAVADPRAAVSYLRGVEDFAFSSTRTLIDQFQPDVVHLHNLHGNYFNLEALPDMTRARPTVATLHDSWLMTGHCAQSLECERWRTGCGACPHLSIAPAVGQDVTAANWSRKNHIYRNSRLHIAAPTRWAAERAEASMLQHAAQDVRVIPHGVDIDIFSPGDAREARARLALPATGRVLLAIANGGRANHYKDVASLERALVGLHSSAPVTAIVLGASEASIRTGRHVIMFRPFTEDIVAVADYLRAADIYVHPAKAEQAPMSIMEAMACGRPVIASAVGGIPELVGAAATAGGNTQAPAGLLVPPSDSDALRSAIATVLADDELRQRMGAIARRRAVADFDVRRAAARYVDWYRELVA